jgi:hypothetical protein
MTKYKIYIISLFISTLFIGCEDKSDLTAPTTPDTGTASFAKFVSIGNSLTAGYQSSALYESAQKYSYGKMIAEQIGADYEQPLISDPGIGGRIDAASVSPFSTTSQPSSGLPINANLAASYNNMGIPGALLPDMLLATSSQTALDPTNVFFDLILRGQGTVLEQARAAQPTFATLWIGNNDILGYATSGGIIPHTPTATFAVLYDQLCGALALDGIPVVLANIPNVRAIPYFTTVAPSVGLAIQAAQAANPAVVGLVYQMTESPFIGVASVESLLSNATLLTLRSSTAAAFIGDTQGLYYSATGTDVPPGVNTAFPFGLTPENPFPNGFVVDTAEQTIIENVTSAFNSTISSVAVKYGFHLVDVNSFFNEVKTNGIVADGVTFTTDFVTGGLFSLDGVHPTSQGYAIIANKFIEVINTEYSADIPFVNVSTIPGSLSLGKKIDYNKLGLPIFESGTFDTIFY